jgi:hypothetical protein
MWLCPTDWCTKSVICLSKFLQPTILVQISVNTFFIHTEMEGFWIENTFKGSGRLLMRQDPAQKLEQGFSSILPVYTN